MWSTRRPVADARALDARLEQSVGAYLRIPPGAAQPARPTFSGGVALDRALVAARALVGGPTSYVITTTPSIDIMRLLLQERRGNLRPRFVESRAGRFGNLDPTAIIEALAAIRSDSTDAGIIVLLTSPENPTGEVWSTEALHAIGLASQDADAVIVVDHAFLTAGIHTRGAVPAAWDALPAGCRWLATWDTGKTFGLDDDKLGFLISGDEDAAHAVDRALDVIQYDVSRRLKTFFSEMLASVAASAYENRLSQVCSTNRQTLESCAADTGLAVLPAPAGSLALLRIDRQHGSDEHVRRALLDDGVGVVAGRVFFHTEWCLTDLLRVALAREPEHFAHAARAVVRLLRTPARRPSFPSQLAVDE